MPNTFLCCTALHANNPAKIYILHAFSKYPQAPDGTETPWDNRIFCYLGELLQEGAIVTVAVPAAVFDVLHHAAWIYDKETLAVELPQLQPNALFQRLPADATRAVQVRTRAMM